MSLDTNYLNTKPDYLKGWQLFYSPIDREFPKKTEEKFASSPDLPRDLMAENDFLGDKWDEMLQANLHKGIIGALTRQTSTRSQKYEWRRVVLNPIHSRPTIYGDTPETQTMTAEYFQGTLEGTVVGITMPRGFQEAGVSEYTLWWNAQVKMAFDTMDRFAQYGAYSRILNNKDRLKYFIGFRGRPLNITVQEYLETYVNPVVNIFKKRDGWVRLSKFKNQYLDKFYTERTQDEGEQSWIYLISPDVDDYIKLERDENLLYLYRGEKSKTQAPLMSIYEYSTTKIHGDAVFIIKNFPNETSILGKNILYRNKEIAKYYRFRPWKMLCEDKPDANLSNYDIFITNDREENIERIRYLDALKMDVIDKVPEFFGLEKRKSWWDLIKATIKIVVTDDDDGYDSNPLRCIKKITKGSVRKPEDYLLYMLRAAGISKLADKVNNGIADGSITEIKDSTDGKLLFRKVLSFSKFLEKSTFHENTNDTIKSLINDLTPRYGYAGFLLIFLVPDILTVTHSSEVVDHEASLIKALRELRANTDDINKFVENITMFLKNTLMHLQLDKLRDQIQILTDLNIDPPFGLFIFKRPIYKGSMTPHVRKGCIEQKSTKMFVSVSQEYPAGNIHVAIHKEFGELLLEPRNVSLFKETFIKKNILGGDNEYWTKRGNKSTKAKYVYKSGTLWIVPVTLNEVIGPRVHMLDRTGFDNKREWEQCVTKLRLEDEHEEHGFYYSTWKRVRKYYGWGYIKESHNGRDYNFNCKLIKEDTNHWAGYEKYQWDTTFEHETGPFKKHHRFWDGVPVQVHVTGEGVPYRDMMQDRY